MPRPPQHGCTHAGRMARVLRYLADHGGCADSTEIRRGIPGYQGDSGHRLWRRDLAELRRRGLVASHTPGEQMSSRVDLARTMKPGDLFLTLAEHEVLARVEDRLGRTRLAPSPLPADSAPELGDFARLARYLEERPGQDLTYRQVEAALGVRAARLTALLRQIVDFDGEIGDFTGLHPALEWIEYVPPDEEEPEGWIRAEPPARVLGAALKETLDPRERTGQLGFWAYSAEEADDRLDLIACALAEPDLSPGQRDCLLGARRKLYQWRAHLSGR
jgi:hypothetical protein